MENVDRLGPEIVLLVAAAAVLLLDLVLREKRWLPWLALLGIAGSALWTGTFVIRDTQGTAFDGSLAVDDFSIFFGFLFAGVAALVILSSMDYAERFVGRYGEFFALILASTAGLMLLAGSRDLIAIFIALELTSISQYVLAGFLKDGRSTEAALKYILLGAISTAVLLYGMAFLFGLSGSTKLDGIAAFVAEADPGTRAALVMAMVFMAVGFAFKMAIVPFQMWVPDVYEGAPTPVAAYLSVGSKAAAFAVVLRVFYEGLGGDFVSNDWSNLFAALAAASMFAGNIVALVQSNIKRLLGYSSIAQAGYIMVGLAAVSTVDGTALGASSVLFFLAAYALTNLGAFAAVTVVSHCLGSDDIADYAGLARRSPLVAATLAFCFVSLTGLPPTAGFIAKIYIFNAAVQADMVWLVIVAVLNSVLAAFYYLKVVGLMFFREPPEGAPIKWSPPVGVALGVSMLGVLVVGVVPGPLIAAAERAASVFVR